MKKLIALLIILAMALSMMPVIVIAETTAEPQVKPSPITTLYVGTVNALETPQGDGWSFDAATGVLTLNNCTLTESMVHKYWYESDGEQDYDLIDTMIYAVGGLTIELIGENFIRRDISTIPDEPTYYYAIANDGYETLYDEYDGELGEEVFYANSLFIQGTGSLTAGIAFTQECVVYNSDYDYYELHENINFSSGIYHWAQGGVNFSGLRDGGKADIYGGVYGIPAYYWTAAFTSYATFGDNCVVTAYQDVEGKIPNEFGYNWNNNDAWRLTVQTGDAIVDAKGLLVLTGSNAASGRGWTWENNILTLSSGTEVKAVEFRQTLPGAELVLAGDVSLDATGITKDWSSSPAISACCDLEIDTGTHTLTLTGEGSAIEISQGDLLLSGGTVVTSLYDSYDCYSIDSYGGNVTIRDTTIRGTCYTSYDEYEGYEDYVPNCGGINLYWLDIYDEETGEWIATIPEGDLLIENSRLDMLDGFNTSDGDLTVTGSVLNISCGHYGMGCSYADIVMRDSDITITGPGDILSADYGEILFDNCNLNLISYTEDGDDVLRAARWYEDNIDYEYAGERDRYEPDTGAIRFVNMNITEPDGCRVDYVEYPDANDNPCGYTLVVDGSGQPVTHLKATATKVEPTISQQGTTLSYEDLIYVIDIFDVQNADDIDLTADAGMLVLPEDVYTAMDGEIVFNSHYAQVGLKPYKDTGYYYAISEGIPTRYLHRKNYYVGYLKLDDGTYVFSEAKLYNPAIYSQNMLEKEETDEQTQALCTTLLNFNAAAQQYFHPGTAKEDLVNNILPEEEQETDWTDVVLNLAPVVPEEHMVERDRTVFTATGKNLLFEEMISLGAIYKIDDSIVENARECGTIFWTADEFDALTGIPSITNFGEGTKAGLTQYRNTSGQWVSNAPEIAAKDMADTAYYMLGYVVHADGSVSYSGVMSYTIEQYISNMADDPDIGGLVKTLYHYERAAKAALG